MSALQHGISYRRTNSKCKFDGMVSYATNWTKMQTDHYEHNKNDKQNIHRWHRLIIQGLCDISKNLLNTQCGFIHGERLSTRKDKHEMFSIHDRHLLQKEHAYFFKSSTETLIVWEEQV